MKNIIMISNIFHLYLDYDKCTKSKNLVNLYFFTENLINLFLLRLFFNHLTLEDFLTLILFIINFFLSLWMLCPFYNFN